MSHVTFEPCAFNPWNYSWTNFIIFSCVPKFPKYKCTYIVLMMFDLKS